MKDRDRYIRGLATAIVRNKRALHTARTTEARNYHRGCIDGLKMALAAALALNSNGSPWDSPDTAIYDKVKTHIRSAEARASN